MANAEDFDVYAGTNETLVLHARDSSNLPADLTGKTITWYVSRPPARPDTTRALITKTGTIGVAADGIFTVAVAPADTQFMNGDYEHMAFTTDGSGNVAVVSTGRFRIRKQLVS